MAVKEGFARIVEFSDLNLKQHVAAKIRGFDEYIILVEVCMVTASNADMVNGDANPDKKAKFVAPE